MAVSNPRAEPRGRPVGVRPRPSHVEDDERAEPRGFASVLDVGGAHATVWSAELNLFRDLNLDQVIDAVVLGNEQYATLQDYLRPLEDAAAIEYRHAVFRDLDRSELAGGVREFCRAMVAMRKELERARKRGYEYQLKRWFLHAAEEYCAAVTDLTACLRDTALESTGLQRLRDYLATYSASPQFRRLDADRRSAAEALAAVNYLVDIRGEHVRVERFHGETNYSDEVTRTFAKFHHRDAKSYRSKFAEYDDMDHVEGQILERVAQLFPNEFEALDRFHGEHADFVDTVVERFDREVHFYLGYFDYIRPLRAAGLQFSYPVVSARSKRERAHDTFDLALAAKLVANDGRVVCNDVDLDGDERVLVVTGPNQGGKTTFARTFGQLHYLARLGVPVPGRDVALLLCDGLYTHFERPENLHDMVGKLQDDLIRIREILRRATLRSVVIMNEIFTSTTLQDARFLSREVLSRLREIDALCVCVTFIDELARYDAATVSLVSSVSPDDPAIRTFKVLRRPADGRAYAEVIAEHYGLTYERIRERLS